MKFVAETEYYALACILHLGGWDKVTPLRLAKLSRFDESTFDVMQDMAPAGHQIKSMTFYDVTHAFENWTKAAGKKGITGMFASAVEKRASNFVAARGGWDSITEEVLNNTSGIRERMRECLRHLAPEGHWLKSDLGARDVPKKTNSQSIISGKASKVLERCGGWNAKASQIASVIGCGPRVYAYLQSIAPKGHEIVNITYFDALNSRFGYQL